MSRFVHGDLSRGEALSLCVSFADDEIDGADVPRVSGIRSKFDGDVREWTFAGTMAAGVVRGPFKCAIGWVAGGSMAYRNQLSLPDGHVTRIDDPE